MQLGYAHNPSRPPAFPDAPPAILVASKRVIWYFSLSNLGCCERKYAVVDPMIPPPEKRHQPLIAIKSKGREQVPMMTMFLFCCSAAIVFMRREDALSMGSWWIENVALVVLRFSVANRPTIKIRHRL